MGYMDQAFSLLFQGVYVWGVEYKNAYCGFSNVRKIEPNKIECQKLCEVSQSCIGVSHATDGPHANLCYICFDDKMLSDSYGFNFYRKPGINFVVLKFMYKHFMNLVGP